MLSFEPLEYHIQVCVVKARNVFKKLNTNREEDVGNDEGILVINQLLIIILIIIWK